MKDYVCVIGAINLDIKGLSATRSKEPDSHAGKIFVTTGGVARNIAENLALLNIPVYLLGCVGNDYFGNFLIEQTKSRGVDTSRIIKSTIVDTAKYLSVSTSDRELFYAVNDLNDCIEFITTDYIRINFVLLKKSKIIVMDSNLSVEVMNEVVSFANKNKVPVLIDAVSSERAQVIKYIKGKIDYLSPNLQEFESIFGNLRKVSSSFEKFCSDYGNSFRYIILRRGKKGVVLIDFKKKKNFICKALKLKVVEPNGAGDAFNGGFIFALINGYSIEDAVKIGTCSAYFALRSLNSVPEDMTQQKLIDLYNFKNNNEEF